MLEFFCHWYEKPVPVLTLRTTELPWQNVNDPVWVTIEPGKELTVTTTGDEDAEQLLLSLMKTV